MTSKHDYDAIIIINYIGT